uniref:Uncharacterized protein n=1 Tax=Cajanus cajan TaxID=3821 RepID=A0A151U7R6_CAJCA|nr:hypothetical protein KK1_007981 [Cajanus cajan]
MGKQTNFRKLGAKRANLELIHTDICGPFPTTTWNEQQYFIVKQTIIASSTMAAEFIACFEPSNYEI